MKTTFEGPIVKSVAKHRAILLKHYFDIHTYPIFCSWQLHRICFVMKHLRYAYTAACLAPCSYGKLDWCNIRANLSMEQTPAAQSLRISLIIFKQLFIIGCCFLKGFCILFNYFRPIMLEPWYAINQCSYFFADR